MVIETKNKTKQNNGTSQAEKTPKNPQDFEDANIGISNQWGIYI